jgi:hypothetical protein
MRLVIFNANQENIPRCLEENEFGLRRRILPDEVREGSMCILRQTSKGIEKYGAVGIYVIERIVKWDPNVPITGWSPPLGWRFVIKLKEKRRFPEPFCEEFSLDTPYGPKIKESSKVKGLKNSDLQGEVVILSEEVSRNYIQALEEQYGKIFGKEESNFEEDSLI